MSLPWRCAPACGSEVNGSFRQLTQRLSRRPAVRDSGTHWANFCRAYGALCMDDFEIVEDRDEGQPSKLWKTAILNVLPLRHHIEIVPADPVVV